MHIVGDIYDRGPYPDVIMDALAGYHSLDIQWGNHDIVWMGAALGQRGCIAHVVRNCARYGNLSILEDAYGIHILPLAAFATSAYADDPCVGFGLKGSPDLPPQELEMNVKIQKAMAILQFKVEAQLIDENPGFGLEAVSYTHLDVYKRQVDDDVADGRGERPEIAFALHRAELGMHLGPGAQVLAEHGAGYDDGLSLQGQAPPVVHHQVDAAQVAEQLAHLGHRRCVGVREELCGGGGLVLVEFFQKAEFPRDQVADLLHGCLLYTSAPASFTMV